MYRIKRHIPVLFALLFGICNAGIQAQPLTGVWRGKVQVKQGIVPRTYQLELHWERVDDSLRGQAFYYHGRQAVLHTAIEGWVNPLDGTVTWTDTQIIEGARGLPGKGQLHFSADINCPGEGIFKLDGEVSNGEEMATSGRGEVHLEKVENPLFTPSVAQKPGPPVLPVAPASIPQSTSAEQPAPEKTSTARVPAARQIPSSTPLTIEERFMQRKKQLVAEYPLSGDTLEINFYDHAEIDGDSISIFIGQKLWKDHILLKATPFTIKIAVADLDAQTELTMVAENLGTIPPNTSLMIAYINGQRHEARLESTENSSAMIRFTKPATVGR